MDNSTWAMPASRARRTDINCNVWRRYCLWACGAFALLVGSPVDCVPRSSLPPKPDVVDAMTLTANYYLSHASAAELAECRWTHAALMHGIMALYDTTGEYEHLAYALRWGDQNGWITCNIGGVLTEKAGADDSKLSIASCVVHHASCTMHYARCVQCRAAKRSPRSAPRPTATKARWGPVGASHGPSQVYLATKEIHRGAFNDTYIANIRDAVLAKLVARPAVDDWCAMRTRSGGRSGFAPHVAPLRPRRTQTACEMREGTYNVRHGHF